MKKLAGLFFVLLFFYFNSPIHAQTFLAGDIDESGTVNLTDYSILVKNFLKTNFELRSDITKDGIVNLSDYLVLVKNFLKSSPPKKTTLVFINEDDYLNITPTLNDFKTDVEKNFNVNIKFLHIADLRNKSADYVRQVLIDECGLDSTEGCKNIEGAIMVGDIPYALYDQKYDNNNTAPFMFYYQDLDSTYKRNSAGHYYEYDTFGPHEGPEIYLSWIKAIKSGSGAAANPSSSPDTLPVPIVQLQLYFEKHHRYLTGEVVPSKKVVAAFHCSLMEGEIFFYNLRNFYTSGNYQQISPDSGCDNLGPSIPNLLESLAMKPELAYLHSHGNEEQIWSLTSSDFLSLTQQPLLIYSWGCQNGSFYQFEGTSTALAFINGKDLGLSYIGKLDDSDLDTSREELTRFVNVQQEFFNYWTQGMYVGKALLTQYQSYANYKEAGYPENPPVNLYRESGPPQRILIGSPFVRSSVH